MSIRNKSIYIEGKTIHRLMLVQKLYPQRAIEMVDAPREKTADEIADDLINQGIKEKYPKVLDLEKLLAKTEREFVTQNTND